MEKQTGVTPKELEGPGFPFTLSYLWSAFLIVNASRQSGFNGPLPLGIREFKEYSDLYGVKLSLWEISTLREVDRVYMKVING